MPSKDLVAREWRRVNKALLNSELKPFLDKAYRRSKSKKSVDSKYGAVTALCGWLKEPPSQIAEEVKSGKTDLYKMLDDFTGYLDGIFTR